MANGSGYGGKEWPEHTRTRSRRKIEVEVGRVVHKITFTGYADKYECMICAADICCMDGKPKDIRHKHWCPAKTGEPDLMDVLIEKVR